MSNHLQEIEVKGKDVEAAIEAGLAKLGLRRSDVTVEILDEGSRGILGIGAREAVVSLKRLVPIAEPETKISPPPIVEEVKRPEMPVAAETAVPTPPSPPVAPPPVSVPTPPSPQTEDGEEDTLTQKDVAIDIVRSLLEKMQVNATVTATLSEPDDITGEQIDVIEINGDDLGVLIGPRGDTLSTIQYLTRLIASHRLRARVDFVLDVQGYRQRRQQALSRLAERMAKKAMQRGQAIGLEPMPPHERRIIHMTLREHNDVYTESSGEGDRRKVRIIPK